jgi:Fe-Mn family superoxide dismutase
LGYTLPDLPYDYSSLEPHISGKIIELHHDKHHHSYVKDANATLEKLEAARASDDFGAIVGLEKTLAFNVSGHVLHSIYWQNMIPGGGGEPDGELADALGPSSGPSTPSRPNSPT